MNWVKMQNNFKIMILAGNGKSSRIMYHALKNDFKVEKVIIEEGVSKKVLLKNRIRRLGLYKVIGQVLFMLFNKVLLKLSFSRITEIKKENNLSDVNIKDDVVINVKDINDNKVIDELKKYQPNAVVVNGTRILSEHILNSIKAPFINTHVGITPKYRGVHGGYWALVMNDIEHCGVTIHIVDKGIDTGGILYQDTIDIKETDDFNTYPYLQLAKAIPMMKRAIFDVKDNEIKVKTTSLSSRLWSHPTLFEYMKNRMLKGIK